LKGACLNFLGNVKVENCKELVEDLLSVYRSVGCNVSLKIHFITFPLGFLPSEPERRTWGKVPPRYFHHEEKACRKSPLNMLAE
jgi:hypothetical protein